MRNMTLTLVLALAAAGRSQDGPARKEQDLFRLDCIRDALKEAKKQNKLILFVASAEG